MATRSSLEAAVSKFEAWFLDEMEQQYYDTEPKLLMFPLDTMQRITEALVEDVESKTRALKEDEHYFLSIVDLLRQVGEGHYPYPIQKVLLLPFDYYAGDLAVQQFFESKDVDNLPGGEPSVLVKFVSRYPELNLLMAVLTNAPLLLSPTGHNTSRPGWLEYELDSKLEEGAKKRMLDDNGNSFPGLGQDILPFMVQTAVNDCGNNKKELYEILKTCFRFFDITSIMAAAGEVDKSGALQRELVTEIEGGRNYAGLFENAALQISGRDRSISMGDAMLRVANAVVEGKFGDVESIVHTSYGVISNGYMYHRIDTKPWIQRLLYASLSNDAKYRPAVEGPLTKAILEKFSLKSMIDELIQMAVYYGNVGVLTLLQDTYGYKVPSLRVGEDRVTVLDLAGSMPTRGGIDRAPIVRSMIKRGSALPPLQDVTQWRDVNLSQMVQVLFRAPMDVD